MRWMGYTDANCLLAAATAAAAKCGIGTHGRGWWSKSCMKRSYHYLYDDMKRRFRYIPVCMVSGHTIFALYPQQRQRIYVAGGYDTMDVRLSLFTFDGLMFRQRREGGSFSLNVVFTCCRYIQFSSLFVLLVMETYVRFSYIPREY